MTLPRLVLPGRTSMVTRRCTQRQHLLRPSPEVNQAVGYHLGLMQQKFGIGVHAFETLSNHLHSSFTDVHGNLPAAMQWFDQMVARCLNCLHKRRESFWAPGSYSNVHTPDPEDVLDKCAYILANPTTAGLVDRAEQWPGFGTTPGDWREGEGVYRFERPKFFYSENSTLPEVAELHVTCPPELLDRDREEVIRDLEERVEERERESRRERRARGREVLGAKRALAMSPFARAKSHEPFGKLDPTIASKDKWRRIGLIRALKHFRDEYRRCFEKFRAGDRSVVFPAGTWGPRLLYGALVAPAPAGP